MCIFLTLLLLLQAHGSPSLDQQQALAPGAYLAINALAYTDEEGFIVRRRLEMNWFGLLDWPGEVYASLYDQDPDDGSLVEPLLSLRASEFPDGFHVTDYQLTNYTNDEIG